MKLNMKKLNRAFSVSAGLLVAFFAQKWFEQAYQQPTDFGKLVMLLLSLIFIGAIIYFNLDKNGNF